MDLRWRRWRRGGARRIDSRWTEPRTPPPYGKSTHGPDPMIDSSAAVARVFTAPTPDAHVAGGPLRHGKLGKKLGTVHTSLFSSMTCDKNARRGGDATCRTRQPIRGRSTAGIKGRARAGAVQPMRRRSTPGIKGRAHARRRSATHPRAMHTWHQGACARPGAVQPIRGRSTPGIKGRVRAQAQCNPCAGDPPPGIKGSARAGAVQPIRRRSTPGINRRVRAQVGRVAQCLANHAVGQVTRWLARGRPGGETSRPDPTREQVCQE